MNKNHHILRQYRISSGLSCADLAKKLGIAEVTARSLENGTRKISAERAVDIETATAGGVKRHELRPDIFGPAAQQSVKESA